MNPDAARSRHVASIRSDTDRISAVVRTGALEAPVAACPGWDVAKMVEHVGFVHRWSTAALLTGSTPAAGVVEPIGADEQLAVWIVDGATALIDAIETTDPLADTWHPFPAEQRAWVWARRQAVETTLHRWDAETATAAASPLDPAIAVDGLHEFMELGLPRVLERERIDAPSASLHLHCTDVDGEWLVWGDHGQYRMLPVHDKGDAALRGTAESLLLVLMGRAPRDVVDVVGAESAAAAWLDLPGW